MILGFERITGVRRIGQYIGIAGLSILLPVCIEAQTELDVLVIYTQAVETYYGDEDGVLAHVQSSIASANTGFSNSANSIQLILRDLQKISYVEGSSLPDDLTHITASSEVSDLRNQVGADLVCLFRNGNAGGLSGYGWILGSESGDPGGGFSVVGSQSATSSLTFQHEVGHNLGGAHDRDNASVSGLYSYSHGYRFTGGNATQYRTVMAYSPGQSINYFSNPSISYQSTPTGIASGEDSADNARTFSMIAAVVEAYRDRVVEGSNSSPTLVQPIPDQLASVGADFDLDVSSNFDDVDISDVLDFTATIVGGAPLPLWLSLNPSTGVFAGIPSSSDVGSLMIEVTASDGEASVSDVFELEVEVPNQPPVLLTPIVDQVAIVDLLFSLDVSGNFDDADEDPLQFGAGLENEDPLPNWLNIDFETGVFSGTPTSSDVGSLSILVGAFDGEDVAMDTFVLSVEFPNQDPVVVQAIPDQVVDEDMPFSLDISSNFGDADAGDTLTFAATLDGGGDVPIWLALDGDTGMFTGTPENDDVAVLSIEVTASDGEAIVADVFVLTVNNVNDSPALIVPIVDQIAIEDVLFSLDVSSNFDDIDVGDSLSFEATLDGGGTLPGWIEIDEVSGVLSGTPFNGDVGSLVIEVTASDGALSVSDVFGLIVENSNDNPVLLLAIPDQSTIEDELFSLDVSSNFGDPDLGDSLAFTATLEGGSALPDWLSLDPGTGVFSGTPANGDVDSLTVEVTATDGVASVSDLFDLIVDNVNDTPVLVSAILDQEATEDIPFSKDLSVHFSDVDVGDTLAFSATLEGGDPLPTWLVLDLASGILSGLPSNEDVGLLLIEVAASDGEASVSDIFELTVTNVNDGPTLVAPIVDQDAVEDVPFSLDASLNFEDVDLGDSLLFSASQELGGDLPGWLDLDQNSGIFSGTPVNEDVESIFIEVTVSDGDLSASDVFNITVSNTNDPPVLLSPIPNQVIAEDSPFDLDISPNFGDVDIGDVLAYTASLESGDLIPVWMSFDANSGVFTGTPDNEHVGEIRIKVTASDENATVSDIFILMVDNVNDGPSVLEPIADQVILEDDNFQLDVSPFFQDIDVGDALSFSATLAEGGVLPVWLQLDAASGLFMGMPGVLDVGSIVVDLTVSDGELSVTATFTIAVKAVNSAPVLVSPIEDLEISEDELLYLDVSPHFDDVDEGDTLAFEALLEIGDPLPGWLKFDETSGEFTGIPGDEDIGAVSIRVTASDGLESVSDVFEVEVISVNHPPVLVTDLENRIVQEGERFVYTVSEYFKDPDEEDVLSYSASLENGDALPAWLGLDSISGIFSGVPWRSSVGTLAINVTVSDGDKLATGEFLLQIVPYLQVVKIGHEVYLELIKPIGGLECELWESKDLINWELSAIQPDEVNGKLRFRIPNSISCLYRIEVSE